MAIRRRRISALNRLEIRLRDAERLVEIHEEVTGINPGRRRGYDTLNRSAVMLSIAAWEAFCEDLASKTSKHYARNLLNTEELPASIREPMIQWLYEKSKMSSLTKETRNALWSMAGNGWRTVFLEYALVKIRSLNTPNYENLKKLYNNIIGVPDIAINWTYGRWSNEYYITKLNGVLDLRHRIAHGSIGSETVGKQKAKDAIALVRKLAADTNRSVSEHKKTLKFSREARLNE